jgi:serine/threonine protein kinase
MFSLPHCPFCKAEQPDLTLCKHNYSSEVAVDGSTTVRLNSGTRLPGGYEVGEFIGSGGVACVYHAKDSSYPGRRMVVRYHLLHGGKDSDEVYQRFARGIRVVRDMQSPYVPEVYDVGRLNGPKIVYAIMEFIPHTTLGDVLAAHPDRWLLTRQLRTLRLVAKALDAMHQKRLVHRDVKPDNIMVRLGADGEPEHAWLIDFDLVKILEGSEVATTDSEDAGYGPKTQLRRRFGTAAYMSPEVAAGGAAHAGPESDLYALGVILFEMLTGELPFNSERGPRGSPPPNGGYKQYEITQMHIEHAVMPLLGADAIKLPAKVKGLLARLTAKKQELRIRSAEEVVTIIDAALAELEPQSSRDPGQIPEQLPELGRSEPPILVDQQGPTSLLVRFGRLFASVVLFPLVMMGIARRRSRSSERRRSRSGGSRIS